MLEKIAAILEGKGLVNGSWVNEQRERAKLVNLYREYYRGEHRLKLTAEMKKMMQIADSRLDRYNDNYCEMVVNAVTNRMQVDKVAPDEASAELAMPWIERVMRANRFDALQMKIHKAVMRDGETYVIGQYNEQTGLPFFAQENAYDGEIGVLVVWDAQRRNLVAGVKVWNETTGLRVNIYYIDSMARYGGKEGELVLIDEVDTGRAGVVPGVPIVVFSNRRDEDVINGESELVNVIPLQDSLNRTMVSMVMSAELSAFSVLFAVGFSAPQSFTPGMIVEAALKDAGGNLIVPTDKDEASAYSSYLNAMRLERVAGGSITELISQADWLIMQIATITGTPIPMTMGGDSSSGEALKQREVMLLGKVRAAQVGLGNSYEDMMRLGWLMQFLYGNSKPPMVNEWDTQWKDAALRNDAEIFVMFQTLHNAGYEREALRVLSQSSLVSYSEADITRLMDEKIADVDAQVRASSGNVAGFEAFAPLGV